MARLIVFFVFILIVLDIYAQSHFFVKKWDKRFGGYKSDFLESFQQTTDGGFILGGGTSSGIGGDKTQNSWDTHVFYNDYWIVKIDSVGNKEWDKRFGGIGDDYLIRLTQTFDGGYILGGHSGSGISGDKTQANWGGYDDWVVKIDATGNKEWDKRYGGTLEEICNVLIKTEDKGYLLGGYSNSPVSGDKTQDDWDSTHLYDDIWLIKVDSNGNKKWDKRYGGKEEDGIYFLLQTKDRGYALAASSNSGISGDKTQTSWGGSDGWLIKIDSLGNKQWDKRYGGTDDDGIASIIETDDGGYILGIGSYSGISGDKTANGRGYWVVKIDSIGNVLWDKTYSEARGLATFAKTKEGGYLLSGISNSNAGADKTENNMGPTQIWMVKTDSVGNKQWDKTIFTTKYSEGYVIQTTDGCFAVGAYTASGIGGYKTQANWDGVDSTYDYWIMKFCMDTVTGIDDGPQTNDHSKIQVWPNPFTTDLSIALTRERPTGAEFTITNLLGQTIYHQTETNLATGYTKMLDLSYLSNGLYVLEVTVDGERMVRQIVKQ